MFRYLYTTVCPPRLVHVPMRYDSLYMFGMVGNEFMSIWTAKANVVKRNQKILARGKGRILGK